MSKCVYVAIFVLGYILVAFGESMIGPGKWKIYHISYNKGNVNDIVIDFRQKMLNRTHYVYSGKLIAAIPFDYELGVKMDVCKYVDGGCKQYQMLTDDTFISFLNKYAGGNIKTCLEQMGVDPPELPLPIGEYSVDNYLFDVGQLPENFTYGRFIADACAMRMGIPVGCVLCECEFVELEEDDDCDD